MPKSFRL